MPIPENNFKVAVKGATAVAAWLGRKQAESEKAMNTAIRVEAFRLRNRLRQDLRRGAPGGVPLKPLSHIAARSLGRSPSRKALARMAPAVRYLVAKQKPFTMKVGFVRHSTGMNGLSNTWLWIAKHQQEGFTKSITDKQRRFIVGRGADLGTVEGGSTPFFLKKSTRTFTTPARPIVDPFWRANKAAARANIRKNFKAKLEGRRI